MTTENHETPTTESDISEHSEDVSSQPAVQVGSGDVAFDRITGDLAQDINSDYDQALRMHAKLNESYMGYKYSVRFPASMEATISPELLPEEMRERYQDEKLRLGKMDVFPTWFKKIGASIRSYISSTLSRYSSNADIRFGYMIKFDKFEEVEASLLAARGIVDADYETYAGTDICSQAQIIIDGKLDKRNEWELNNQAPVTYLSYIDYMYERYDVLRAEIISEYRRMFSEDLVDVITGFIPTRESLRNPRRIKCEWTRTQEVPSCVMQGNTSYRAIADRIRAPDELNHEKETIRQREIESWRNKTLDTVSDIQKGIRSMIADKVSKLKIRLDRTLMTEDEIEERKDSGAKRVVDPARVTENSVTQLTSIIDDLTGELGSFDSTDEFYQAISEFRRSLNMEDIDLEHVEDRQMLSENIDRIVELALDDSSLDPESGEFFVGIM